MITYKNISFSAKTFYGVKFEPGEIKSVPGFINSSCMVRVFNAPKAATTQKPEEPIVLFEPEVPIKVETRGRKKKSSESEKVSVAENTDTKLVEKTQEEISDGNYS